MNLQLSWLKHYTFNVRSLGPNPSRFTNFFVFPLALRSGGFSARWRNRQPLRTLRKSLNRLIWKSRFIILLLCITKRYMRKRKWIFSLKQYKLVSHMLRYYERLVAGYETVKRKISELNLDTSHMTGMAWNQGKRYRQPERPLSEAFRLYKYQLFKNETS